MCMTYGPPFFITGSDPSTTASQFSSELGTSRDSHSVFGGEQLLLKDKRLPL